MARRAADGRAHSESASADPNDSSRVRHPVPPAPRARARTGARSPRCPGQPVISSSAERPFSASNVPPSFSSGRHQRIKRSSGASARAVTTSYCSRWSSARARTTRTRAPSPRSLDHRFEECRPAQQRLEQRHRQVRPRDGQRDARQSGAGPHVHHRSHPIGMRSASARLFRMCRSQMRSASRGPITPAGHLDLAIYRTYAAGARRAAIELDHMTSRQTETVSQRAGRPRAASALRPRRHWSDPPRPPRRARSCARTGSSARAGPSPGWT